MDNREKARILADRLYPSTRKIEEFVEMLEDELNRLDNPEPKKWEPRGGKFCVTVGMSPTGSLRINCENIFGRPLLNAILSDKVEL